MTDKNFESDMGSGQGEFGQGQYEQGMGSGRPPGEEGIFPGHHHHEHNKKDGEKEGEKKEGLLKKVENIFHKDKDKK